MISSFSFFESFGGNEMDREELFEEIKMSYDDLCRYLVEKYGSAKFDYFPNPQCKSKQPKLSRTSEGLYCHHIDEDKGVDLSKSAKASIQPFAWQKADRLVYCNALEHLILHMKIAVLRQKRVMREPRDISSFFTTQGVYQLCEEINDMYRNGGGEVAWKRRCFQEIEKQYEVYVLLIKSFLNYIETNYQGDKSEAAFLVLGSKVHFSDCDCEILKISPKKNRILLKLPNGEENTFFTEAVANSQLTFSDAIDIAIRKMACGNEDFYTEIYNDISKYNGNIHREWGKLFLVDYHGYGFPQFADILLENEFGAINADEYISKAFPSVLTKKEDIAEDRPCFWKGRIPTKVRKDNTFYIVRFLAIFRIKKNQQAFIYDKSTRFALSPPDEDNNFLYRRGILVKATDKPIEVTLTKDDYALFFERYDVYKIKEIDGCILNTK